MTELLKGFSVFVRLWSSQPFPQTDIHSCRRAACTHARTRAHRKDQWESASLAHTHSPSSPSLISDLLGSDLWHLHTSDLGGGGRTHAGSHTNKIKRGADRWREGRLKEVHSETLESFGGSRGDAGTRRRVEEGRRGGEERAEDDKSSSGVYPRRSLKSMQPKENQSALLSYAVPFWRTSGAM